MSLQPATYEGALQKARSKPQKPRTPLRSRSALKTPPARRGASKKPKRKKSKVPKTARVQAIFNTMVKEQANWICVKCRKDFADNKRLLQCSHFWGVGFTATRFDFDNCDPLCYPCHYGQLRTGWEYCKQGDYRTFMLKKLGEEGYDRLEQKARSFMKLANAKEQFLESLKNQSI